jgi:hypothetical protein
MLRNTVVVGALASASAFAPSCVSVARRGQARQATSLRMQSNLSEDSLLIPGLEGKARRPADIRALQKLPSSLEQKMTLTPELFQQLDTNNSGSVDVEELKALFSTVFVPEEMDELGIAVTSDVLLQRADLDGDGRIDYAEYERLMNMQRNGDEAGGNMFVRTALKIGLLKAGSPLADGEASILVGNKGFDPLGFATSLKTLKTYREAELKHGRLAMLAALGWPVSELLHPYLAKLTGSGDLLVKAEGLPEKVPSILNGGLEFINPLFFLGVVIFSGTVESVAINKIRMQDYTPGDLGFDPLNIYRSVGSAEKQRELELKELNNGRLAMIAITGYAAQEFVTKVSVVGV